MPLKGCRFKDTPVDPSYVVLGRYFRTVVAWARQKLSRRLATVRMFTTGETLASVAFLCFGREEPACESSSLVFKARNGFSVRVKTHRVETLKSFEVSARGG